MNELKLILKDIDIVFYSYDAYANFSAAWGNFIENEMSAMFAPVKNKLKGEKSKLHPLIKRSLDNQINESYCRMIYSKQIDYIYLLVEYISLFCKEDNYNFDLFLYCEHRMRNKTDERRYLLKCIKNVHQKVLSVKKEEYLNNVYSCILETAERLVLARLFLCEPPDEKTLMDQYRMIQNVKQAEKEELNTGWYNKLIPEAVTEYTRLLVEEIEAQWKF